MGETVSFSIGCALLAVSYMVMRAYRPRSLRPRHPNTILGFAIFLSFLALAVNTFWWQILSTATFWSDVVSRATFRSIGLYLDGGLKGASVAAGIMHLIALQRNLPDEERDRWSWFQMPWYPQRRYCLDTLRKILTFKDF